MKVKRLVANFVAKDIEQGRAFYQDILGLELLMDHGWIQTYGSKEQMTVQISLASQGGADTAVPDLTVEVDDVDEAFRRMQSAGFSIEYGPVNEAWGVRRFYVRDPLGKLVNILAHT